MTAYGDALDRKYEAAHQAHLQELAVKAASAQDDMYRAYLEDLLEREDITLPRRVTA